MNRQDAEIAKEGKLDEPDLELDALVHRVIGAAIEVESLLQVHRAQVLSYLKAGAFQLGLLINFNVAMLRDGVRREIWSG